MAAFANCSGSTEILIARNRADSETSDSARNLESGKMFFYYKLRSVKFTKKSQDNFQEESLDQSFQQATKLYMFTSVYMF